MKKGPRVSARSTKRINVDEFNTENMEFTSEDMLVSPLDTLQDAWKSLPDDFDSDERFMFLDLAEKIIKLQKNMYPEDATDNSDKN